MYGRCSIVVKSVREIRKQSFEICFVNCPRYGPFRGTRTKNLPDDSFGRFRGVLLSIGARSDSSFRRRNRRWRGNLSSIVTRPFDFLRFAFPEVDSRSVRAFCVRLFGCFRFRAGHRIMGDFALRAENGIKHIRRGNARVRISPPPGDVWMQ